MWNQRSPYHFFLQDDCYFGKAGDGTRENIPNPNLVFSKVLGEAEITEVFKIIMGLTPEGQGYVDTEKLIDYEILAKMDGFKTLEHMMAWFDNRYDLSQPKPFWVYRWRWL